MMTTAVAVQKSSSAALSSDRVPIVQETGARTASVQTRIETLTGSTVTTRSGTIYHMMPPLGLF